MTKLKRRIGLSHGEITRQGTVVVTADLIFAITAKE
jgi:hypothetical protein